jgi:hypothetical protein
MRCEIFKIISRPILPDDQFELCLSGDPCMPPFDLRTSLSGRRGGQGRYITPTVRGGADFQGLLCGRRLWGWFFADSIVDEVLNVQISGVMKVGEKRSLAAAMSTTYEPRLYVRRSKHAQNQCQCI